MTRTRTTSFPVLATRFHRLGAAAATLLLLAACAAEQRSVKEDVRYLVDHGEFEKAVRESAAAAEAAPSDASLQDLHREASVAYILEQGRRLTFEDKDVEALAQFQLAVDTDPSSAEAKDWLEKTHRKLARKHLVAALELHAKDEIQPALENYEKALEYMPADKDALIGRDLCVRILERRAGLGRSYFDEGVRALSDYWLEQARSRFSYSHKYQPTDERTEDRKTQVEKLLASQRMSSGKAFEDDHDFGAARNEYRVALALDSSSEEARAAIERVQRELEVETLFERADMDVVRGQFDDAAKLVEEAGGKTRAQHDQVEGHLATLREARLEQDYRDALVLEHDFRFDEAIQKYGELLQKTQFYKDVIARKDTLEEYTRLAADLYAKAAAETDPAKKLGLLVQIRVFWPEYKDIRAQIEALSKPQSP